MKLDESEVLEFGTKTLFTFRTYMHLCETSTKNFVVSPFLAETLFVMVLLGAEGETAAEIQSNLDCLICSTDTIGVAVQEAVSKLLHNPNHLMVLASKFYIKENCKIKEEFKAIAETITGTEIENISFSQSVDAAASINAWVEEQTRNKILNLMAPENLNESTNCILVCTAYFKINWEKQFMRQLTHKNNFYKSKNEVVKVETMRGRFDLKYCNCPELNIKMVEKKFKGDASMVIVLPNEEDGLSELDKKMDTIFNMDSKHFKTELVDLYLPKFKIATKLDYKEIFESRGVRKVFKENEADLEGIAGSGRDFYVNSIIQKIRIEVDEAGIDIDPPETGVPPCYMCIMFPPIDTIKFTVDRPFAFFIKVQNTIIFAGKVLDPSEK